LLQATYSMHYRLSPWIGMRERPTRSRFVNVSQNGIRSNGNGAPSLASLQGAIWFFGGSTTFGYGVADHETIPARLEKALARPVANFGVAAFFSAQENMLLIQALRTGYRPAQVIFLDGINEACDVVDVSNTDPRLENLPGEYEWKPLAFAAPVLYAAGKLHEWTTAYLGWAAEMPPDATACDGPQGEQPLTVIQARMLAEREGLCRLYTLVCTTFVQPFPGVHGRHADYQSLPEAQRAGYREKFEMLTETWKSAGAIFVTDALDQHSAHAWVDGAHYSQAANALIAGAIAARLPAP
jgi:hypothetical protein